MSDHCVTCGVYLAKPEDRRVETLPHTPGYRAIQVLRCPSCAVTATAERARRTQR